MPNRLAVSTSPYLRQHADNPVDWREWGDDAFAEARERDVPLLISTGYAACHWCHVMAHESFEDEATATFMNEHFVNVKVDREERPDVDAVYMDATQAMTGHGGWPMTVFATPSGEPFYCGTYFPPRPVQGMPSFGQVIAAMADAWQSRRGEVVSSAAAIREALGERGPTIGLPHGEVVDDGTLDRALTDLARTYDPHRGGFGSAPKFPPSMLLEWLLRHWARTGSDEAMEMADRTLEAMARGGMYDQLGGGFARYSVDADWVVPHFEKMLYDNALLLRVYTHWWRATASPLAHRVVTETADWLLRELRTTEGGFASALDADSEGREGAFYVWTPAQLVDVLGPDDGAWAAEVLHVTAEGTFEHGESVLQLLADPDDPRAPGAPGHPERAPGTPLPVMRRDGGDDDGRGSDAVVRYASIRARLFAAREQRERPARDDKVVAAWNGLAIAALAEAGALLERDDWVAAAGVAAELVVDLHLSRAEGTVRLARISRDGVVGTAPGVLEDYADVAEGLLALYQATSEDRWVAVAGDLLAEVLTRFVDGEGGFFDTAADQTDAVLAGIRRPRDPADGPAPSGQAAAAGALLTHAALTGSRDHREAAVRALTEPVLLATRYPRAAGWALAVAEALLDGPREVAVVGSAGDPGTADLRRVALRSTAPGAVLAVGGPDHVSPSGGVALLAQRPLVHGRATAYVCRGFVCDRPTNDAAELAQQLTS